MLKASAEEGRKSVERLRDANSRNEEETRKDASFPFFDSIENKSESIPLLKKDVPNFLLLKEVPGSV